MTREQAMQQAAERWGSRAQISEVHGPPPRFRVGKRENVNGAHYGAFTVLGEGETWEQAFQAADRQP